jgi:hypothetical protein
MAANSFIDVIQKIELMNLVDIICVHLSERIESNHLSNEDCIKIIEHVGSYLNLKTIPDYAKDNKISYNGVKKFRKVEKIFNVKFVIENE